MKQTDEGEASGLGGDPLQRTERQQVPSLQTSEPRTIHYSELPEAKADSQLRQEWKFYRQVIGQLLAAGHEGKWLLIENEDVVGIWDTEAHANTVRLDRFLMQPVLMKEILRREPILRIGYNRLCRS